VAIRVHASPLISGSASIAPQSMPFDFAHENMELALLPKHPFAPHLLDTVLSVPISSRIA